MPYSLSLALVLASTTAQAQWNPRDAQGHPVKAGPEYALNGDFGVHQISTTDPEALEKAWKHPTAGVTIATQSQATRNQPIFTYIVFRGCKPAADGKCHVTTQFTITDPNGKPYGHPGEAPIWNLPPAPKGNLLLGEGYSGLRIEDGELLGPYTVVARTTDHVANVTLTTQATLTIKETPLLGGWSAVATPANDPEIRAAAQAMLAQIPTKTAKLLTIEKALEQLGLVTNLRLTLRLTDKSQWTALVHHKKDGTFVVESPARTQ
jgi:hypothetical protein